MKSVFAIFILGLLLLNCKDKESEPLPAIKDIYGTWRLEAYERTANGEKTWELVPVSEQPYEITFRFDGVILNDKGLPACCTPDSYKLNGVPFKIEPKEKLEQNPQCNLVDCISSKWEIEQNDDELIISLIDTSPVRRSRYVRQ